MHPILTRRNALIRQQPQQSALTFTVKSDNAGASASNQFIIPSRAGFNYNYQVTTSDGYSATVTTDTPHTITFPSGAGTHQVFITGLFEAIYFNNGGDKNKLISVDDWGDIGLADDGLNAAFRGCINAISYALDIPYTNVTNLIRCWSGNTSATQFPNVNYLINITDLTFTWNT